MYIVKKLPSLNFLNTFETVARHLSFTNAAKELYVSQAAVSHQIRSLEQNLGVELFHRDSKKIILTKEGEKLLPSVVSGLQGIADSIESIRNYDYENNLVVGLGSSFSANWLVHHLGGFYQRYPDINLHLKISNNDPNFRNEGTDLAVVWGKGDWNGVISEKLMAVEFTPVCSPELLKKNSHSLNTPEDLIKFPLLDDSDYETWQEWLDKAGISEKIFKRRLVIKDSNVLIRSALDGHGVALSAVGVVQEYLDSGELVRPFNLSISGGGFYYLIYPEKSRRKPLVKLFKNWLIEEINTFESK
tara:strand:+ start:155 stop:1060 length:906 start_codon:yes stop_codon:yes gene_type:complete